MQSDSIDKTGFQFESSQSTDTARFKFRILFGEFCLLQKYFDGQIIKPNIFATRKNFGGDDLYDSEIDDIAHIISAPCGSEHRIGTHTSGQRLIYTYKVFNRMFVDVRGDYSDYLANFRKRSLSSLNRKIKKAEKSNKDNATIVNFTNTSEVRDFVRLAKPISAQSYQEAQLGTVFRTDEEWIGELETLAEKNRFRGYVLYINDQAVAYNYCPVYGEGILLYDLSGYLPESSKYSPGTVLQAHIIKQSFADETIHYYDLCEGEGRHKEQFATGSHKCFNAYVFPKSPYFQTLVRAHLTLDRLSDRIVGLLNRLGLKDRIKTYLRRLR